MKKQFILKLAILVVLGFIIINRQSSDDYKLKPISGSTIVLCFGDSLTFGTGARPGESYPAVLERQLNCTVINAGIPGETTDSGVNRIPALLEKHQPQLLILCEGGNDFLKKRSENTKSNLAKMIQDAQSRDVEVLLIGVPKPGLLLSSPELYEELSEEFKIPLLNDIIPDILSKGGLKSDYAHPNAAGYKTLAKAIMARLI